MESVITKNLLQLSEESTQQCCNNMDERTGNVSITQQENIEYIKVLTIAGSDSGGGAGIQADLKTFSALGCFGTSVITAVTAQNTLGVKGVHAVPVEMIQDQLMAVLEDIKPAAIKIGMINKPEVATLIRQILVAYAPHIPVILDPVMVATSGHRLIEPETVETLQQALFTIATLVTPNIDEAIILAKHKISNVAEMIEAAHNIIAQGANAVLLKGGHLLGTTIYDVFVAKGEKPIVLESPYINSRNLHGTGCTLSSAIAAEMAKGNDLITAVQLAKIYIAGALQAGAGVKTGAGNGPLNHFFEPLKLIAK